MKKIYPNFFHMTRVVGESSSLYFLEALVMDFGLSGGHLTVGDGGAVSKNAQKRKLGLLKCSGVLMLVIRNIVWT